MNIKILLEYNRRGLFPIPGENESEFLQRMENFNTNAWHKEIPICLHNPIKWHEWDWAKSTLVKLFDVSPDWIEGYYTNQKLFFWQGAMTWIWKNKRSIIQLRKSLKRKKYLRLYEKDEILAHEAVHAVRMSLNSSKTEEFFAYWSATSLFRRIFGPIIQKPYEANVFMLLIMIFPFAQLFGLSLFCAVLSCLIMTMVSFACFRLFWIRWKMHKSLKKLKHISGSTLKARAILFRLTDKEIFNFSKWSKEKIKDFIFKKSSEELRWQIISLAYSLTKSSL